MKIYKVTPAEKFGLEFNDKVIEMRFDTRALAYLAEMMSEKGIESAGPMFCSAVIYSGIKSCNTDYTWDEAEALYLALQESCADALSGILAEYYKSIGISETELKKNAIMALRKQHAKH